MKEEIHHVICIVRVVVHLGQEGIFLYTSDAGVCKLVVVRGLPSVGIAVVGVDNGVALRVVAVGGQGPGLEGVAIVLGEGLPVHAARVVRARAGAGRVAAAGVRAAADHGVAVEVARRGLHLALAPRPRVAPRRRGGARRGRAALEAAARGCGGGVDLVEPGVGGLDVPVDVGDALAAVVAVPLAEAEARVGDLGRGRVYVLRLVEVLRPRVLVPLVLLPEAAVTDGPVQRHAAAAAAGRLGLAPAHKLCLDTARRGDRIIPMNEN